MSSEAHRQHKIKGQIQLSSCLCGHARYSESRHSVLHGTLCAKRETSASTMVMNSNFIFKPESIAWPDYKALRTLHQEEYTTYLCSFLSPSFPVLPLSHKTGFHLNQTDFATMLIRQSVLRCKSRNLFLSLLQSLFPCDSLQTSQTSFASSFTHSHHPGLSSPEARWSSHPHFSHHFHPNTIYF